MIIFMKLLKIIKISKNENSKVRLKENFKL